MKKVTKRRNWWKRPLAVMLSATLVASSFSMVGVPERVQAAEPVGPGGVAGSTLWLRADKISATSGEKVSAWDDQSNSKNNPTQNEATNQPIYWNDKERNINFNPVLDFNGINNFLTLDVGKLPLGKSPRTIITVAKTNKVDNIRYTINWGKQTSGSYTAMGMLHNGTRGGLTPMNSERTQTLYTADGFLDATFPHELFLTWTGGEGSDDNNKARLYSKMKLVNDPSPNGFGQNVPKVWDTMRDQGAAIGKVITGNSNWWDGTIEEIIVYERALDDVERQKISSYLAIKYGYTINQETPNSYVDSARDTIWDATTNANYNKRITSIGRDDDSGLNQKQAKAEEEKSLVTIALGDAVAETNSANETPITTNRSFFTFGDNGQSADFATEISNTDLPNELKQTNSDTKSTKKMERVYKVDKTSNWTDGNITLQIDGADEEGHQFYLYIHDTDATFLVETTKVFATDKATGIVTLDSNNFPDGSYFTFVKHVDKKALESRVAIIDAENLQEADYTPERWQVFAEALAAAKTALTNADKTESEVQTALDALNTARAGLEQLSTDKSPGGIGKQPVLWLKADGGATADSDEKLTGWIDQTGKNTFAVNGTPKLTANGVNFNPAVTISGNSGKNEAGAKANLVGNTVITYEDAYAVFNNPSGVVVGSTTGGFTYGPAIFSKEGNTFYAMGNGQNSTYTTFIYPSNVSQPRLANADINDGTHTARLDGKDQTLNRTASFAPLSITPVIGSTLSNNSGSNYMNFNGNIAEVILYDTSTAVERAKIETYLAVKYGITLEESDYIGTDGTTLWDRTANETYHNNIAGIGRDDAEGLHQKQSQSINEGTQVAIGKGALADSNITNTNSLTDKQYLIWGDNGEGLTFTKPITSTTDKYHAERIWKVQNTGDVGEVQVAIPAEQVSEKTTLLISNSESFNINQERALSPITLSGVDYYAATVTLTDGHYFTFAAPAPVLESATLEQTVADGNKVTLTFDQEVELTNPESAGFTITVDGQEVTLQDGDFAVDPTDKTKLVITLPNGTDVTDKTVNVSYNGNGNLKGTNGAPVGEFEMDAEDPFAGALKITEPSGDPVTEPKPEIKGEVEVGSDVTVVIKDKDGNVVQNAGGEATVDGNGNWSFTPSIDLGDGDYTIEVTATKGGKSATKTKEITVQTTGPNVTIDEPAGNTVNVAKPEFVGTATLGSTVTAEIKDGDGNVIGTPTVTMNPDGTWSFTPDSDLDDGDYTVEVTASQGGKSTTETKQITVSTSTQPTVDKTALKERVDEIDDENLDENSYTPSSWQIFKAAKDAAEAVLNALNATQQQVNDALDALNEAYNDLDLLPSTPTVDKSLLKARVSIVEGLTESDYTEASWADLEPELRHAISVLDDQNATQQEIDDAYAALKAKHDALVYVNPPAEGVDKTKLEAEVDAAEGLESSDYTQASWDAFERAKRAAEQVLADNDADQAEVNEALTQLIAARDALIPAVDKSALQAKVNAVNGEHLNGANYTPASWQALQNALAHAQTVLDNDNATQTEVDAALARLTSARNGLRTVDHSNNGQLISLVPSFGSLSPSFSSDHYDYTLSVGYGVSQLPLSATAFDPYATMEMSVNGQAVTNGEFPLVVGRNVIVITVTDSQGNKAVYTLIVTRQSSSGGGSGGGGGGTSEPSTPTPSDPNKETIIVDLEIDGDNPLERTRVTIERTKEANGQIHDFVALTPAQAQEAVDKAKQIGNDIARIVIPDVKDEVDRVTIEVSKQSIQILRDNGISLEISTDNAHLALPVSSMEGIDASFYFRLVPVKKEHERNEIEERARVEQVVREAMQSDEINVVARPMTIETNLSSRPVILTLPLKGVDLPADPTERQAYLNRLGVFIEHSDGEKKVVFGEIVTMANGDLGIRFSINKFSTFTIIHFGDQDHHDAYLKGFPDGFFKPNQAVTRAQVAAMVARNLGYTGSERTSVAPFTDVAPSHYASGVITFVKDAGIMTGDHNGQFRPNDTITRAEMATVIANYKQLTIQMDVAPSFNDTKGHWAEATIEATRQAGLVTGYEDGRFAPNGSLTRAEAVVMMNRMFERGPLHGVTKSSFPDVHPNHWAFKDIEEAATTHSYFLDQQGKEQIAK